MRIRWITVVVALSLLPSATQAAVRPARLHFAVPPMALDAALIRFSAQSGIDVGSSLPGVAAARSPGVSGDMPADEALRRLLAGTSYRATSLPAGGYRIDRVRMAARRPDNAAPAAPLSAESDDNGTPELIVTASKRPIDLLRFPGSVVIAAFGGQGDRVAGVGNSLADVASRITTVQATALGAGRNKLFIRGIADSSFLGPTASTTAVYLGDVLLAYNGPAPNLSLVDVDRIEILEGPQGTLYGAGAIGGVIRLTPRAPELATVSGSAEGGLTTTKGGAAGHDVAATLNLPLVDDRVALRLTGYETVDGGYVDDALRGLRNVNRTETRGGRATLRFAPGGGWIVDLGVVAQKIDSPDSQYALRGLPGLTRRSAIAQPFRNEFLLHRLEISNDWDSGLHLMSATGLVHDHARDRFDATMRAAAPLAYDTDDRNNFVTHETRLSQTTGDGGSWLAGASFFRDRDVISRAYGSPQAERTITGVTNRTVNAALFGEATIVIARSLAITAGARLTHTEVDGAPAAVRNAEATVRGRRETRIDPTVGLSWLALPHVALFARYQPGFRTGGLAVAPGVGRVAEFRSDGIRVGEAGVRLERSGPFGLAASVALSLAHWRHIQADLVDSRGFPFTTNTGSGRIAGVEGQADWLPVARLHLTGGFFLTSSRSAKAEPDALRVRATRLPDTPRVSAESGIAYKMPWQSGALRISADAQYVGSSYLDPAAMLNIRQGNYAELDVAVGWHVRALDLSLRIDNLADGRGDRFALGNPFGVAGGGQFTPLRPRSARLGAAVSW